MPGRLFEPLRLGHLTLNHRVVMAPLTRLRADENHVPQPMSVKYYEQRASVPGTFIISESTQVSLDAGGGGHAPGIFTNAQIQAWKRITGAVHARGSYIFLQLVALGRAADPQTLKLETGSEVCGPSPTPMKEGDSVPKALTEEQINSLIRDFATAAESAIAAGFDGVEVHGANGYLVDQFLQDVSNKRSDKWGGSIEKRARFAVDIAQAIAEAIGPQRLGFRLSPWSTWQGMGMANPVPQFSHVIKKLKDLGLAYLHLIESRVFNNVDCEKNGDLTPFLEVWGPTAPILVAGGYNPENVHQAIEGDYGRHNVAIVFGRHFLANPDLPFRLKQGIPLQPYDRNTFYARMESRGYLDYPFSSEFKDSSTS